MRVGLIGRTGFLLDTARALRSADFELAFLCTATAADYSDDGVDEYAALARELDIPFIGDPTIAREPERLARFDADVCASVNWPTLIPRRFLDSFAHGVFNAHAGDLPRYRGNATLNWAILNGETEACLSIHRMTPELDAGPIAAKARRPIHSDTTITELYAWLGRTIPDAFVSVFTQLRDGTLRLEEQDATVRPLRAFPRKPQDSRIDWRASTDDVLRVIRASSRPFAGASTSLEDGTPVTILAARGYSPDYDVLAVPGQVCLSNDGNPVIATGDGMVEIIECDDDARTRASILSSLRNRLV